MSQRKCLSHEYLPIVKHASFKCSIGVGGTPTYLKPVCERAHQATHLYVKWHSPGENHSDVLLVARTPRSEVPASLRLVALQLKPSLSGLRATNHPLFTPSLLVLIQVTRRGRKG